MNRFEKAFEFVEQQFLGALREAEEIGIRFGECGEAHIVHPITGKHIPYDGYDSALTEMCSDVDLSLITVVLDLAEHMGYDSELIPQEDLVGLFIRALQYARGAELPL